ncbi:glycoside hydrolase family 99-like domain-containing protein [Streptomyces sp. 110]|uniref:Glycoside hydrolase family 99-like domain-containing protein n=1 Tax=Streptomyces endocoffeicus TaxID=2898945 RepID=A0ABS1Q673_9ACTN|nr:glycoside hydrolase family 99-like domain-containing protein [Streptomyces endocoffeicus]MBL1120173.1 glycoside hydrolase family 99-like domain-containing protein [Streptomyces endocoffeicus]
MNGHEVTIAAYYFPNYHVDPRNEQWHGEGWTEWELTRKATPRFEGHIQPRVPLHGYEDEADPAVMAGKIEMATSHGVNAFIFDWYWYGGRPYLERALEQAFLPTAADREMKFAVMWANHHWTNIHPWKSGTTTTELESGSVDAAQFREATDYLLERYVSHPAYLHLDGRPYLSIYDLTTLIKGLGGIDATKAALDDLRGRAAWAGHSGLHLNAIARDQPVLPQDGMGLDEATVLTRLGFDSVTSYVWAHHHPLPMLLTPYPYVMAQAEKGWTELAAKFDQPYYPNVTVGWDSSPRTVQSDGFNPALGYPHTNVISQCTPENFGEALERVRGYVERTGMPLVTINAWNEWTEGTYLEPDTVHEYGHLEQIRRVFGTRA